VSLSEEHREFLATHRLCVVAAMRADGPPSLTPVYYVMDGDDLLISTTHSRAKTKLLKRDPRVSVCVLGEEMPFPYVTVFGRTSFTDEGAAELMAQIGEAMMGSPVPEEALPGLRDRAEAEGRVVMRVRAERAIGLARRG